MYVYVMYMSCNACAKTLLLFCVYKQRLCHVFVMCVIALRVNRSENAKNQLIYCITSAFMCAKAELCLRSICVYCIRVQRVSKALYCSVYDCAVCKSIWKCEKSIDLLHYICLYICKSWIMSLQYIYICHI